MLRRPILAVACAVVLLGCFETLPPGLGCVAAPIDSHHLLSLPAAGAGQPGTGDAPCQALNAESPAASFDRHTVRMLQTSQAPSPTDSTLHSGGSSTTSNSLQTQPLLPLRATDVVLFIICFGVLALAAGAGIGGRVLRSLEQLELQCAT